MFVLQEEAFDRYNLTTIADINADLKRKSKGFVRNNRVIIVGLNPNTSNKTRAKKKLEQFLWDRMGVNVTVAKVKRIKDDVYVVELGSFKEKTDVVENTYRLKDVENNMYVYIEPDRTSVEKQIQDQFSLLSRNERTKGNYVQLGYLRMFINNAQWVYDDKTNNIMLVTEYDQQ